MLGQFTVVFGFFTLVIVMIYWVNRAITLFDELLGDGQSLAVFGEFTLLLLPFLMFIVLPLSAFAATVQVTNRLSQESELVALQAAGLSAFRLARPALIFGGLVALLLLLLAHVLVPASRARLAEREAEIAQNATARYLDAGRFLNPATGITFFIGSITDDGVLERIFLSDKRTKDRQVIYTAEQALIVNDDDAPRLIMINGLAQDLRDGSTLSTIRFENFAFDLGDLAPKPSPVISDLRAYSTGALLSADPTLRQLIGVSRAAMLHEAHVRFSKPALAVAAAMLGMATLLAGGFSRFGLWQQVLGAVALLAILQMTNNAAENIALQNADLVWMLYLPAVFGLAMVGTLLWLADNSTTAIRTRLAGTRRGRP